MPARKEGNFAPPWRTIYALVEGRPMGTVDENGGGGPRVRLRKRQTNEGLCDRGLATAAA